MTDATAPVDALLEQWRLDLASWAIPDEILSSVEVKPWIHPVALFTVDDAVEPDSPSHRLARAALPDDGSVLDVGSGGGRASVALVPPAGMVVAVDHQQDMLDAFADAATRRGVRSQEFLGDWPAVADDVPECDVVVCHHVAYNVGDIGPFLLALDSHARRRVVVELPMRHPLSNLNDLWKQFWDLDRPTAPTAHDLHAIAIGLGFDAQLEPWLDDAFGLRSRQTQEERVRFTRVRLCLPEDREPEVADALAARDDSAPREVATLWWDVRR